MNQTFSTKTNLAGFTLVELLIVIAIVGALANMVVANMTKAKQSAEKTATIQSIKALKTTIEVYFADVGSHPLTDCTQAVLCNASNDPFANDLGEPGWKGPYVQNWDMFSVWGGHIGYKHGGTSGVTDVDGDGIDDHFIILENDRPSTSGSDNSAMISTNMLLQVDESLDDGDLTTGNVRGDGNGWTAQPTEVGELYIRYSDY